MSEARYEREKRRREEAERLLREKALELYEAKQDLEKVLTEREKVIEDRTRELAAALDRAAASDEAKTVFLGTVSHELRTPLNVITGMTEILDDEGLNEEVADIVGMVSQAGQRLTRLVDDLLDFTRIERGTLDVEPEPMLPVDIVRGLASEFDGPARAAGVRLDVSIREDCDVRVMGDPGRIHQILSNLIQNALKFAGGGVVTLSVGKSEDGDIVYGVADDGPGIDPEFLPDIFDRFAQAEQGRTRSKGGLGLGLAISHQLVELMGGAITVENRETGGAAFTVTLPLPPTDGTRPSPSTPVMLEDGGTLRLLIVDDVEGNRFVAERLLLRYGHTVDLAESGADALVLAARSPPYDIAFLDLHMPQMDGFQLLDALRSMDEDHRPKSCVALTADITPDTRRKCAAAGFDGFLTKPVDRVKLLSTINRLVDPDRR